jgi:hypothetical protein
MRWPHDRSEMCTRPSMPSSMPTKMPKSVMFRTLPLTSEPTGYCCSTRSQGLVSSCFMPRLMRLFSMSIPRTLASMVSPTLTSLDGCLTRLFQVISEMWTRPSMPSSSSTNAP